MMKTAKDLELSILLKEKVIQELKLTVLKQEEQIKGAIRYIKNNYEYIKNNPYMDKLLEILKGDKYEN